MLCLAEMWDIMPDYENKGLFGQLCATEVK